MFFNKGYFPSPVPLLQLLLTGYCTIKRCKTFIVNKGFHTITACEPWIYTSLMLGNTAGKIIGNANV